MNILENILHKNKTFFDKIKDIEYDNLSNKIKCKLTKILVKIYKINNDEIYDYVYNDCIENNKYTDLPAEILSYITTTNKNINTILAIIMLKFSLDDNVTEQYYDKTHNIYIDFMNYLINGSNHRTVLVDELVKYIEYSHDYNIVLYYIRYYKILLKDALYLLQYIVYIYDPTDTNFIDIYLIISIIEGKFKGTKDEIIRIIVNINPMLIILDDIGIYYSDIIKDDILTDKFYRSVLSNNILEDDLSVFEDIDIPYEYFSDICKYQSSIIKYLSENHCSNLYNDICDVYVVNNKKDDTTILHNLINDGYYVNIGTYYLAKKSGNVKCAEIIKKNIDSNRNNKNKRQ
jgi:hypothetical protein